MCNLIMKQRIFADRVQDVVSGMLPHFAHSALSWTSILMIGINGMSTVQPALLGTSSTLIKCINRTPISGCLDQRMSSLNHF